MYLVPPIIDMGPESVEAIQGDDVTLRCEARGNPDVSFQWFLVCSTDSHVTLITL